MSVKLILPDVVFHNGEFAPGAKVYIYQTGTTTPVTTYTDAAYSTPHEQPFVADAAGRLPAAFYGGAFELKAVITTASDEAITTIDPVPKVGSTGTGAADVSIAPVVGNTATDVETFAHNTQEAVTNLGDPGDNGLLLLAGATPAENRTNLGLGGLATLDILDEDDFASDSATRPPSQQSTAAFVASSLNGRYSTLTDVSGSRTAGTWYENTSDAPVISQGVLGQNASYEFQISADGGTTPHRIARGDGGAYLTFCAIVPPSFSVRVVGGFVDWIEIA